jgi:hypothetical protein
MKYSRTCWAMSWPVSASKHSHCWRVGEGEIEGVLSRSGEAHELDGCRVFHEFLDQGGIQFGLPGTQQQREADGLGAEQRRVNLMDILEIYKDVVHWL